MIAILFTMITIAFILYAYGVLLSFKRNTLLGIGAMLFPAVAIFIAMCNIFEIKI